MSEKIKNTYLVGLLGLTFLALSLWAMLKAPDEYSMSERRELDQFPPLTAQFLLNGDFMSDFEDYTLDQFPLRDTFRSVKAFTSLKIMQQSDSNGYYIHDGYIAAMEYPLSDHSISWAGNVFQGIYDKYLADSNCNVYLSIVPDKNFFLAEDAGILHMDYDKLYEDMYALTPWATPIDIRDTLTLSDYYKTDTHWRQECIVDTADTIASAMGTTLPDKYTQNTVDYPFKGVYFSQLGLTVDTEELHYLTSPSIAAFRVADLQNNGRNMPVYNLSLAQSRDPYEMFLSGAMSMISITNPRAETDRELVIFRDSFGSAMSPLLAQGYAKTTIIDIRYVQPAVIANFVDFENQDVLFLYSTLVLNSSASLKR